jgi:uncharacterized protein YjbI with pentapeptide repeats
MQTKNLTPFAFGAKVTSRKPPQLEMTMIVRARFRLEPGQPLTPFEGMMEQGALTGDLFAEGDDERAGELVYAGDFADFKVCAEVLLRGACHAPNNKATTECQVGFSVGAWSKSLRVVGRRVWTEKMMGQAISDPAPFVKIPIVWANAFGGPEHPQNPVGRGLGTPELPTLELPDAPLRSRASRPEPAGFGPINPAWPQRRGKVGKEYGASYRKTRAPFYAEDFDWTYFSAAPVDQQLRGYLRGDEEVSFQNLHPEASSFSVRLPGLRIRAFAKDREQRLHEAPVRLDTLLADLDEGVLTLTWRGLCPVKEDDLADVQTVLIASEPLSDRPLPEAHYRAIVEAFEADPLEKDKYLSEEAKAALAAAVDVDGKPKPPGDMVEALLGDRIAASPPEQRPQIEAALGQVKEVSGRPPPQAKDPASAAESRRERVKELASRVAKLKEQLPPGTAPALLEELNRVFEDPKLAAYLHPSTEEPRAGADLRGADLSLQDLSGKDLSGADLSGANLFRAKLAGARVVRANLSKALLQEADLSGADLSGADLSGAFLNGARAVEAILSGAVLDQAILDRADLTGAILSEARGQMVVLAGATLRRVNARKVDLFKAVSLKGDLEDADFSFARLVRCVFMEAKGRGLVLGGAVLDKTSFAKSDLRGALVGEISGPGSIWMDAVLDGVDFSHAKLPGAHFINASAKGARFFAAVLRGASFYRADLTRAELVKADLLRSNLNKCLLHDAKLTGASMYEASMLGAAGERCDFTDANLKRVAHDPR